MSHSPSDSFLVPESTSLLFLCTFKSVFVNSTVQSSSHNWPNEIKEALLSCGRTAACWDLVDKVGDRGRCPVTLEGIESAFGRVTLNEVFLFKLVKQFASSRRM